MKQVKQNLRLAIRTIASDKDAMRLYEMREMALSDYTSRINHARRENTIEIAKNLLKLRAPFDMILQATGLSALTIKELQSELVE